MIDPATGTISGTLDPGSAINGPYTVEITATDPAGNLITTAFVWDVEASGAAINALLGQVPVDPGGLDNGQELPTTMSDINRIEADGIVTSTANNFRSLNGNKSLSAERAVLTAVNSVNSLDGTDNVGVGVTSADQRLKDLVNGSDGQFGRNGADYSVKGAEGFSSRLDVSGTVSTEPSAQLGQLIVDTFIRDNVLYVETYDNIDNGRASGFTEFSVTLGDGRALPSWISFSSDGILIVERPAHIEAVTLKITGLRENAQPVTRIVEIDTPTGEIRDLDEAEGAFGKSFSQSIELALADDKIDADVKTILQIQ